nr:hypothetical protein [Propionicimonas sp.]
MPVRPDPARRRIGRPGRVVGVPAILAYRSTCRACRTFAALIVEGSDGRLVGAPAPELTEPVLTVRLLGRAVDLRRFAAVAGFVLWVGPARAMRVARHARRAGVLSLPRPGRRRRSARRWRLVDNSS